MKATELRIGNYVNFKDRKDILYCEVNEISLAGGTHIIRHFKEYGYEDDQPEIIEDLTPIPLTEDWLLKFEHESRSDGFYSKEDGSFRIRLFKHNNIFKYALSNWVTISLEYVHTYQNLYFALTGKELQIN